MKGFSVLLSSVALISLVSCGSSHSGVTSDYSPSKVVTPDNKLELVVREEVVSTTLDITTPYGKEKLKKRTLEEAKTIVLAEANKEHKCSQIINPQYTYVMKGDKVKSITVVGQPAILRNPKSQTTVFQQGIVVE